MKNLYLFLLLFFCLNFQSCDVAQQIVDNSISQMQNASYYGTWKCDRTGTITGKNGQGQTETGPITTLYDQLKISNLKFELQNTGVFKSYQLYTNKPHQTQTGSYSKNYQNNPYAILINTNNDQTKMTFSDITVNTMKVTVDFENDGESIASLNLLKVN